MKTSKQQNGLGVQDIAAHVAGTVTGDPALPVAGLCSLDEPIANGLTLFRGRQGKLLAGQLRGSTISAVLVGKEFSMSDAEWRGLDLPGVALIRVPDVMQALISIVPLFISPVTLTAAISPRAEIDPSARIGTSVSIGAFSVIGPRVEIGADSILHPHVVIYEGVRIGRRVTIHSGAAVRERCEIADDVVIQNGAVIGAEGFGYIPDREFGLRSIPQIGVARLGERVEVGANSCVDRATLGSTVIGRGTKIDNLVQIGHNTKIGEFSILCGQVGIAGSVTIGDRVTLAGQAGVGDHISIAGGSRVGGMAGVTGTIEARGDYMGMPAIPAREWRRQQVLLQRLPEIVKGLKRSGNA